MSIKEDLRKVWRLSFKNVFTLRPFDIETGGLLLLLMGIGGIFMLFVSLFGGLFQEYMITIIYALITGFLGFLVYKKKNIVCLYIAVCLLMLMVFLSIISFSGPGLVVNGVWFWVAIKSTPWFNKRILRNKKQTDKKRLKVVWIVGILIYFALFIIVGSYADYYYQRSYRLAKSIAEDEKFYKENPLAKYLPKEESAQKFKIISGGLKKGTVQQKEESPLAKYMLKPEDKLKLMKEADFMFSVFLITSFILGAVGIIFLIIILKRKIKWIAVVNFIKSHKNNLFICIGLFITICAAPNIKTYSSYRSINSSAVFFAALGAVLTVWGILKKVDERRK